MNGDIKCFRHYIWTLFQSYSYPRIAADNVAMRCVSHSGFCAIMSAFSTSDTISRFFPYENEIKKCESLHRLESGRFLDEMWAEMQHAEELLVDCANTSCDRPGADIDNITDSFIYASDVEAIFSLHPSASTGGTVRWEVFSAVLLLSLDRSLHLRIGATAVEECKRALLPLEWADSADASGLPSHGECSGGTAGHLQPTRAPNRFSATGAAKHSSGGGAVSEPRSVEEALHPQHAMSGGTPALSGHSTGTHCTMGMDLPPQSSPPPRPKPSQSDALKAIPVVSSRTFPLYNREEVSSTIMKATSSEDSTSPLPEDPNLLRQCLTLDVDSIAESYRAPDDAEANRRYNARCHRAAVHSQQGQQQQHVIVQHYRRQIFTPVPVGDPTHLGTFEEGSSLSPAVPALPVASAASKLQEVACNTLPQPQARDRLCVPPESPSRRALSREKRAQRSKAPPVVPHTRAPPTLLRIHS